jgi:hypothetical protein
MSMLTRTGGSAHRVRPVALHLLALTLALVSAGCPFDDENTSSGDPADDESEDVEKEDAGLPGPDDESDDMDGLDDLDDDADEVIAEDAGVEPDSGTDEEPVIVEPLDMCAQFDALWGLGSEATPDDRAFTWSDAIMYAYTTGLNEDCRVRQVLVSLSEEDVVEYVNVLYGWSQQLFGCPDYLEDMGPLGYGLTNTGVSALYTSADAEVLNEMYVTGVQVAIAEVGGEPFSEEVIASIHAKLDELAALAPDVIESESFSNSTCEP